MLLDRAGLLAHLRRDTHAMVADLPAVDLGRRVPSCPGWTVADLVGHLASVHRWATAVVRTGLVADEPAPPADPAGVVAWFEAGVVPLLDVLAAAVPGTPCWNFGPPPRTVDFWIRRQPLETAVHRWDLLDATGVRQDLAADLAADGVDEVATVMYPRQVRLGRIEALPAPVDLVCAETGQRSRLNGPDRRGEAAATVTGPASDLLLLLWRRVPLDSARLTVAGSAEAAAALATTAVTP